MKKSKLAYLLAASHSGSTLLAMLLGAHEDAITVGELKASSLGDPNLYRCSCKQLLKECSFWRQIEQEVAKRGVNNFHITDARTNILNAQGKYLRKLLSPLVRGPMLEYIRDGALNISPAWRSHKQEVTKRNIALIESVLAVSGAKVAIDSSKVALRLKYLMDNEKLDIKVIRVIRDGRAVSLTYLDDWTFADSSDPALRNGGTGRVRPSVRQNMHDAAREWKRSNEAADALLNRFSPSQCITVKYEDLCSNLEPTLRRLTEFLELDPGKINLNFRKREQHVIGNGMRFDTSATIKLDDRWKKHLSAEELETFDKVAGSLNKQYGYV